MVTWLLNPKNLAIVALGVCLLGLGIWLSILKIEVNTKKAKVVELESQVTALTRQNEILNNNAVAAKEAETKLKKLLVAAEALQGMTSPETLPEPVKEGLHNETIEHINKCLGAFFSTGVLPEGCGSTDDTVLPPSGSPQVEGGNSKLPEQLREGGDVLKATGTDH